MREGKTLLPDQEKPKLLICENGFESARINGHQTDVDLLWQISCNKFQASSQSVGSLFIQHLLPWRHIFPCLSLICLPGPCPMAVWHTRPAAAQLLLLRFKKEGSISPTVVLLPVPTSIAAAMQYWYLGLYPISAIIFFSCIHAATRLHSQSIPQQCWTCWPCGY